MFYLNFISFGIAEANKLSKKSENVIAVIGDGIAISAGMAYEAMNNAKTKMIEY